MDTLTCPRHHGAWGTDPSCITCTDLDGNAEPHPRVISRRERALNAILTAASLALIAVGMWVAAQVAGDILDDRYGGLDSAPVSVTQEGL